VDGGADGETAGLGAAGQERGAEGKLRNRHRTTGSGGRNLTDAIQRTSRGYHRDDQLLLLLLLHSSGFEYLARGKRLASCLLGCGHKRLAAREHARGETTDWRPNCSFQKPSRARPGWNVEIIHRNRSMNPIQIWPSDPMQPLRLEAAPSILARAPIPNSCCCFFPSLFSLLAWRGRVAASRLCGVPVDKEVASDAVERVQRLEKSQPEVRRVRRSCSLPCKERDAVLRSLCTFSSYCRQSLFEQIQQLQANRAMGIFPRPTPTPPQPIPA